MFNRVRTAFLPRLVFSTHIYAKLVSRAYEKRSLSSHTDKEEKQMSLFEKKVPVFKKRDKETCMKVKAALKEAGIRCWTGHYQMENIVQAGYAGLDIRNLGPNGRIDRDVYYVNVKQSEEDKALEAIRAAGLVTEVMTVEQMMEDAPKKHPELKQ